MTPKPGFFNKRGVSPLIATVLLISFAVALGSVVLQWGKSLPISNLGDICSGVAMKIRSVNGAEVCYSGSGQDAYINFILDNNGEIDIEGLQIHMLGEKGIKTSNFDDFSIKKGNLLDINDNSVKYDFNANGDLNRVKFNPIIKTENLIEICTYSIKTEKIRSC